MKLALVLAALVAATTPAWAYSTTRCTQSIGGTVTCTTFGGGGMSTTRCRQSLGGTITCTNY